MSKVKVAAFSISLDGFGAGVKQDLTNPLGVKERSFITGFSQQRYFRRWGVKREELKV